MSDDLQRPVQHASDYPGFFPSKDLDGRCLLAKELAGKLGGELIFWSFLFTVMVHSGIFLLH